MLEMPRVREVFEASTDFTVGLEEEFATLDPHRLLDQRFEELRSTAWTTVLAESVAGELIKSEIEIRSGRGENFADAVPPARGTGAPVRAGRPSGRAARRDRDTPVEPLAGAGDHRHRALPAGEEALQYVAWRNNTFSPHVHVGVNGAERAIRVCDRLRVVMTELLAISANSPFLDGRDSGLHSARSQIFTKSFPRCGIRSLRRLAGLRGLRRLPGRDQLDHRTDPGLVERAPAPLVRDRGDAHLRRADERRRLDRARCADHPCIAQAALDDDEGVPFDDPPRRMIEENFWRAIRYGLDGKLIDLDRAEEYPAAAALDRLLAWTAPARGVLRIDLGLPDENGAQRQKRALAEGATMEDIYAAQVALTQRTYAAEEVTT